MTPRIQSKQGPFEGQAASAAPSITDAEQRTGEASGQGVEGLAAERNAGGPPPFHGHHPTPREDPWPKCPECDGDGYTETWNDDQSDVVISVCSCQVLAQGIENAWAESEAVDE